MGKGGNQGYQGKGGSKKSKKDGDSQKKGLGLKCVDEWNHLTKKLLKAYPEKDTGSMMKHNPKKMFKVSGKHALFEWMTADCTELVARPPMGVHFDDLDHP